MIVKEGIGPLAVRNAAPPYSVEGSNVENEQLKREVRRASKGDRDAAGRLFDAYYPRIYRYALAKLRRPADAEDVAAETFARVIRDLGHFKWRSGGFEAWLFRIASNLVVDHVRRTGRESADDHTLEQANQTDHRTPESAMLQGEIARELNDMMLELAPDQREVLLLRFAGGLNTDEVAGVMKRNTNAVRQLQFRALTNLRDRMQVRSEGV